MALPWKSSFRSMVHGLLICMSPRYQIREPRFIPVGSHSPRSENRFPQFIHEYPGIEDISHIYVLDSIDSIVVMTKRSAIKNYI